MSGVKRTSSYEKGYRQELNEQPARRMTCRVRVQRTDSYEKYI
jgi:hypothetical protein